MRLGTGGVVNNAPELFPNIPAIPGWPKSAWYVAQWNKVELLRPEVLFTAAPSTADPLWGLAAWAFPTPSNESHLWVYAPGGSLVFELYGEHGWLGPAGGSNVFLSVNGLPEALTSLEHPTELVLDARLRSQVTFYADPAAMTDGSVVWQWFTGLVVQYVPPSGGQRLTLFLQVRHGDSRATVGRYLFAAGPVAIYGHLLPGDPDLGALAPAGPLTHARYDITRYLCDAVTATYPDAAGGVFSYPPGARDLGNWRFLSLYHGIETQSALGSSTAPRRGAAAAAIQVANIDLVKRLDLPPAPICP